MVPSYGNINQFIKYWEKMEMKKQKLTENLQVIRERL